MMCSLKLPMPLYFMVIKHNKSVLFSALSFFANRVLILTRNSFALGISLDTTPINDSEILS